jgi:DNA (cytosine-5)-methyltransferase 1
MRRELTHGSLFSGIEGFGLGAALAGIKTEWSCEFEKYQTKVIKKKFWRWTYSIWRY